MNLLKQLCTLTCGALLLGAFAMPANLQAQTPAAPAAPTPATMKAPAPTAPTAPMMPLAPAAAPAATPALAAQPVNTAAWQALEPVRQAIARRDYAAAKQALDQAKQTVPNDPAIAVYENLIRTGATQAGTGMSNSVLRTPMPGVTPLPVVSTPVPTPEPTPVATPAPTDQSASNSTGATGMADKAQDLLKNDTIKYAVFGVGGLIILLILWMLFRKKKKPITDASEADTPIPGSIPAVTGFEGSEYGSGFDPNAGSADFGMESPATDFSSMNTPEASGPALAAGAGSVPDFTTFGLDDEEEKAPAKPAFTPRPTAPVEDDSPLSLSDDEPTAIIGAVPVSPQSQPSQSNQHATLNPTPTAGLSTPSNEVNLDDLLGNQQLPGASDQVANDSNSQTFSTFVSTPDSENPEDSVEIPGKGLRSSSTQANDQSISFDELFGGSSKTMPSVAPRTPEPATGNASANQTAGNTAEPSIEDALAATLGAMQAQDPGSSQTPAPAAASPASNETLDERTERMFHDQMEKARQAIASQDWRQAVHVLSIASALHPEHEEAKQMLRDARAEKRKSEESV